MYKKIFVPVDNSEHSITAVDMAVALGKEFESELVGSHAYAARLHDYRFKQMEFTLPDEYLIEEEMEKQRKVHDTLITMGLELISDSYLVVMQARAQEAGLQFEPKMYDGKNFRVIADDINTSDYDLVIMGALGLGAVKDSQIGSVCERVVRRTKTDTLVIKNTAPMEDQLTPNVGEVAHKDGGGIVVAVDGSPESFAGLKTAIQMGKALGKTVEAISAYDPYLHYAMFNSIVHVLTEKASKVFKFQEQEQLHEEVIDTGLAKIYQSHLEVARKLAEDEDFDLKITLLDGKAFEKILEYVRRKKPWLLVMGRIGVHSDESMDIGSNTENLLRLVPCNVLLSSQRFTPDVDVQAESSMIWTEPAQRILDRAPDFAKGIARTTVHRWAMERGHSVVTVSVLEQALGTILPRSSMLAMGIIADDVARTQIETANEQTWVCAKCGWVARNFEPHKCTVCSAEKEHLQLLDKEAIEGLAPLEGAIHEEQAFDKVRLKYTEEARAILAAIPDGYQRRRAKAKVEKRARVRKIDTITRTMVAEVVDVTEIETRMLEERGELGQRAVDAAQAPERNTRDGNYSWTPDAVARLARVPEGFMRNATKRRIEKIADEQGTDLVDLPVVEEGIKVGLQMMEEAIRKQNAAKKSGAEGHDSHGGDGAAPAGGDGAAGPAMPPDLDDA
ncbi:MAG: universal stress protein [Rhodothermales bacterium]|nr:universal stress protein [Rhodothermales bacterium]MBO6778138.1 universal stress protein [Rhodothermales bacterium]